MNVIQAAILGFIQGLAEFLPISSSGHLAIAGKLMNMDVEGNSLLSFNILLHVATLAAVIFVYRADVWCLIKAFFGLLGDIFTGKGACLEKDAYRRVLLYLIIATIPAVVAAVSPIGDLVENSPLWLIGICLMVTAVLLYISDHMASGNVNFKEMSPLKAIGIGCFQAVGVLPGISRSGSTIVGGMFMGLEKESAVKFSFLMSMPAILGATVMDFKNILSLGGGSGAGIDCIIVGMAVAAICGYGAIKLLLKLVAKSKLVYFSYYCAAVGVLTVILSFLKG